MSCSSSFVRVATVHVAFVVTEGIVVPVDVAVKVLV